MRNFALSVISAFAVCTGFATLFTGCGKPDELTRKPIIIWTDRSDIASYTELFNSTHDDNKAVVVYKENPAQAISKLRGKDAPDIVIGTFLKNEETRKNFLPLDYLFQERQISPQIFYQVLLESNKVDDKQYLLPVSFNLPAIVFSAKHSQTVADPYMLTIDQIKDISASFNVKNKSGAFTSMGFGPSWDSDFLYMVTKLQGATYRQHRKTFTWNEAALEESVKYLKEWTMLNNESTNAEQDFDFKYLYTPKYKQVTSERCFFTYMKSDALFSMNEEQLSNLDFRWIEQNHKIPIADSLVAMGIAKKSKNASAAESFIVWFMNEETQKSLLQRAQDMKLNKVTFGIAGGFSTIQAVNENDFPLFYTMLLGNLPVGKYLDAESLLPPMWDTIKQKVIIPYLTQATNVKIQTEENSHLETPLSLKDMLDEWNKQNY